MLKEILENKAERHKSSGKFSVSSIGSCWRRKYSEIKKLYKEEFSEKMFRIFAQGDFFHMQMIKELMTKGSQQGYHLAAAECDIRNNKYISGRCDCILSHAPSKTLYIVDFKSCSSWAFKDVQKGEVSQTYQDQVLLYMHFFHIHRGYLLFINKASSEVEEYEVEYNKERAEFLVNQIKFFFENFIEKDVLPPRCDSGKWGCACCWPTGTNKPTDPQLEAAIKQQDKIPELFKEFISTTTVAPLPESGPPVQTEATPPSQVGQQATLNGRKWVKV